MMAIRRVVQIGGGGALGTHVLKSLRSHGFEVTVLSRKSSRTKFPSDVRVATINDDYPYEELRKIFTGQDAVVSTISWASSTAQKSIIDAAADAGIQRFIPSEFGSVVSEEKAKQIPALQSKLELRKYLQSKESTGMSWTGVANNAFFEWGLEKGFLKLDLKEHKAVYFDTGDGRFPTSTWRTIAEATAGVLKHPEETKNRFVFVQSFWVSQKELVAEFEKATGTEWQTQSLDSKKFVADQRKALAENGQDIGAAINLILVHILTGEEDWAKAHGLDNELLEVPVENLSEMVAGVSKSV